MSYLHLILIYFSVVSTEEGRSLALSWKVPFVETTALDLKVKKEFYFILN